MIGYAKEFETKITRVKHKIGFRMGGDCYNLIGMLKCVPPKAIIDEIISNDESDDGIAYIKFHEEIEIKE